MRRKGRNACKGKKGTMWWKTVIIFYIRRIKKKKLKQKIPLYIVSKQIMTYKRFHPNSPGMAKHVSKVSHFQQHIAPESSSVSILPRMKHMHLLDDPKAPCEFDLQMITHFWMMQKSLIWVLWNHIGQERIRDGRERLVLMWAIGLFDVIVCYSILCLG